MSKDLLANVVWTYAIFENNFGINLRITKNLKESSEFNFDQHLSFKNFLKIVFVRKILPYSHV